jgi:iron(III) transport system permease protein
MNRMSEHSSKSAVRLHRSSWTWITRSGLLIFVLVVLGPLFALIAQTIPALLNGNGGWLSLAIPTGRRLGLLLNSIGLAGAVAIGGIVLGILGGIILWRWETGWRSYLRWLVLILMPIPAYIQALAWTSFANDFNSILQSAGLSAIPPQGWLTAWWIELMAYAPISIGLALIGLKSIEPLMIDAGRVMRSDFTTIFRIVLPLAGPTLLAGAGVLFILSLLDYSVPSLVNFNVYSLEIFAEYSASNEPVRAFLLSLPLLSIATAVLVTVLSTLRNSASSPAWSMSAWTTKPVLPKWLTAFLWGGMLLLLLQVTVPLVMVATEIGGLNNLVSNIAAAHNEIVYSMWVDILVSLLCIPLAIAAAKALTNRTKWEKLLWIIVLAPLAIPPALTGIGLISIWNRPMVVDIYGSSLMPVLAGLARFTPLAALILAAQFRRINPLLIDAARVLQVNSRQTLRYVWIPLFSPGLLAAFGVVFALTAGELGATLLVAPPGHSTLTIRIYNLLHYGASGTVAGLCVLILAAVVLAGIFAATVLSRWSNLAIESKENDDIT